MKVAPVRRIRGRLKAVGLLAAAAVALIFVMSSAEARTIAGVSLLVRPATVPRDKPQPVSLEIGRSFAFDPNTRYISDAVLLDPAFTLKIEAIPVCESQIIGMSFAAAVAICRRSLIGHERVIFADGTKMTMAVFNEAHERYLAYGVHTQDGVDDHYSGYGAISGGAGSSIGVNLPLDDHGMSLPAGAPTPASVTDVRVTLNGTVQVGSRRRTIIAASCPNHRWKMVVSRQVPAVINGVSTDRWVRAGTMHIKCASASP
jgi:hypothetical protein